MLNTRFSRVTKNKRLFVKKNQLSDFFFQKLKILTKLLILTFFIQMFDPPSINALYKFFAKFYQVWSIFSNFFFFASLKSVIDLPKYQPLVRFGKFLILTRNFQNRCFFKEKKYMGVGYR